MTEYRRNVTLMLKNKRIGFPDLAKARSVNGGKPAYGVRIILDRNDPDVAAIESAMQEVAKAQWKDAGQGVLDVCIENNRTAFSRKPYRNKEGKVYKGFEDKFSLGATSPEDKRPTYFDEYARPLEGDEVARKLYAGCYANLKVEIYPLPRADGNRISCALLGAMFASDGEAFGGGTGPATADDFTAMAKAKADAEDIL
jgi:hypothetical protein